MDDEIERKLLITEILALEEAVINSGKSIVDFPTDMASLVGFSTVDLRAVKQRFERLVRSLGGAKQ